jgi:DNA replication and repair protein RecF
LTVILSPSDINIINGPPEIRRKFIDSIIAKINGNYIKILNNFKKILYTRNKILKNLKFKTNNSYDVIEPWDKLFSENASIIHNIRYDFTKEYASYFMNSYSKISNSESPEFSYLSNIQNYDAVSINNSLKKNFKKDIIIGSTGIGPQRDEYTFLNKYNKKFTSYASQGERRTAAVSLKVTEKEIIENYSGKKSIILLDDIFSELDKERKESLLEIFNQGNQIIFTMVENHLIDKTMTHNLKIFNI